MTWSVKTGTGSSEGWTLGAASGSEGSVEPPLAEAGTERCGVITNASGTLHLDKSDAVVGIAFRVQRV